MGFIINNGVLIEYKQGSGVTELIIPEGVTLIGDETLLLN